MRKIELSPRLLALAHQVPDKSRFADVGTDHARLPVWLLEHEVIEWAVATDLREGPLGQAKITAAKHRIEDRISFRLGNGLFPISPEECDIVAIAGMGGETISEILEGASWAAGSRTRFLLQPMTSVPDLRRWLWQHNFIIEREELAQEDKLYVILTVLGGRMFPLTPEEEWVGRQVRGMDAPLRSEYLSLMSRRAEKIRDGIQRAGNTQADGKLAAWSSLVEGLRLMKEEWEAWQR